MQTRSSINSNIHPGFVSIKKKHSWICWLARSLHYYIVYNTKNFKLTASAIVGFPFLLFRRQNLLIHILYRRCIYLIRKVSPVDNFHPIVLPYSRVTDIVPNLFPCPNSYLSNQTPFFMDPIVRECTRRCTDRAYLPPTFQLISKNLIFRIENLWASFAP